MKHRCIKIKSKYLIIHVKALLIDINDNKQYSKKIDQNLY